MSISIIKKCDLSGVFPDYVQFLVKFFYQQTSNLPYDKNSRGVVTPPYLSFETSLPTKKKKKHQNGYLEHRPFSLLIGQ